MKCLNFFVRIIAASIMLLCATTSATNAGIIIVGSDAWTLSEQGFVETGTSAQILVKNVVNLFSPGKAGSFLAFSYDPSLTGACCLGGWGAAGTSLRDTIVGTGSKWTVSTAVLFTLPNLLQYDGIFLSGPTYQTPAGCGASAAAPTCGYPDMQVLTDYVNAGGNVYLEGAIEWNADTEAAIWAPFLNAFGLGFAPDAFAGFSATIDISTLNFGFDPLFGGVSNLYYVNGHYVTDPSNPDTRLFTFNGNGLFGVYDPAFDVPEPGSFSIFVFGILGLIGRGAFQRCNCSRPVSGMVG